MKAPVRSPYSTVVCQALTRSTSQQRIYSFAINDANRNRTRHINRLNHQRLDLPSEHIDQHHKWSQCACSPKYKDRCFSGMQVDCAETDAWDMIHEQGESKSAFGFGSRRVNRIHATGLPRAKTSLFHRKGRPVWHQERPIYARRIGVCAWARNLCIWSSVISSLITVALISLSGLAGTLTLPLSSFHPGWALMNSSNCEPDRLR